ncbi:ParB/RepB/Spo0J family partition protein [Pseudarthrobacter sp. AL07]|uniref:ParB/RepB/Spo0J family partition protein n=1 Tax=unclassified Pseudarthrobacter TaxID=2647000 RepID=UPI00249CC230|nr:MULTISPECIES: ParB/RepB/Spo0J family partition protein [unclassified Pseudarthrobacter]MDI3194476.1 ParB/RepB/Spo0J family partition protein [Pseudarthrobacter sp. AL20]MDI3208656.1 ParB/RepB/Spo0J family partition protein [Pseudarthrobacter sp. AL07]
MSEKRRGLGRGLGALIPSSAGSASGNGSAVSRPVDLFFPEGRKKVASSDDTSGNSGAVSDASASNAPVGAKDVSVPKKAAALKTASSAKPSVKSADKPPAARVAAKAPAKVPAKRPVAVSAVEAGTTPVEDVTDVSLSGVPVSAVPVREATETESKADNGVDLVEVPGVRFAEILVTDIHPNRKQPRSVFDEDDMAELIHSVREIGVLQPIVVRTSTEEGGEPYELVMGERRWRAVQAAGMETIPAIVRDTTDDDLLRDALLENLHRSQLNPLEEAAAYQQLLEDFGTTHEQLADRIGRSRPQVTNTLRLLKLPPLVQRRVAASVLSAGHARALLALPDAAAMERLAQKIVAEGMSVRATEEAVTLYQDPAKPAKNNIPRPGARHERLDYLASSLSDRLDTNVKISLGVRKGRVSIEFASVEDLNRIMDVLAPGSEN